MAAPGRPASTPSQTRTAEGGHPTGVVLADGSGRFGSTLWHLYTEIALRAKRPMSRFHQSAIQSLLP